MKTKKAINILKNQIDKLMDLSLDDNNNSWVVQTSTYIELFFDKDSYQISYFKEKSGYLFKESARKELNAFLNDCIEVISNKGLYKPPTENWFSKLPNWAINLGLPALCFISFSIGVLFTNNNNSELRKENSELKEKLLLISTDTITNQHKNLSDKPK